MNLYDGNGDVIAIDSESSFPPYFETEIEGAVATLKSNDLLIGNTGESFVFITDVHWSLNAQHSPALINYILEKYRRIPVIFGGDAIGSKQSTKELAIAELRSFTDAFGDIIYTIGNHDENKEDSNPSTAYLTDAETYALLPRWSEGVYDCVTTGDTLGMYFDNPSQKIRHIIVRRENKTTLQASDVYQYIAEKIADTPSGWTNIIIMHDGLYNIANVSKAISDALTDGKSAVVFCGHTHANSVTVSNGITFVTTQTDAVNVNTHPTGCATMTAGTATEQAFDVVQIDANSKTVYMTRIGAGDDRTINY